MHKLLQNYQLQARKGLFVNTQVDKIAHCALGLAGEAGEICDMIKKGQYEPRKEYSNADMLFELGDLLWYLTNMATEHAFSLEQVLVSNISKLERRHLGREVYSIEELLRC